MMEDKQLFDIIVKIESSLASIDTKVNSIADQLRDHGQRILRLETTEKPKDMKSDLLGFALKAIIGLVTIIASLTGGGALLSQILGK